MAERISLKHAEREVFRMTVNDGLLDVLIGTFFLQFAIGPLLSRSLGDFWSSFVFVPLWGLVLGVSLLLRKRVIRPRVGIVKFGAPRRRKLRQLTTMMLFVNLLALIAGSFFAAKFDVAPRWAPPIVLGLSVLALSSLAAYFLDFSRLFVYGVLFCLSLAVGEWLYNAFGTPHHGLPATFGTAAGIIIITGIVLFFRTLRRYPVPMEESVPEERVT